MEGFTKFLESGGKEGGAPAGEDDDDEEVDVSTVALSLSEGHNEHGASRVPSDPFFCRS